MQNTAQKLILLLLILVLLSGCGGAGEQTDPRADLPEIYDPVASGTEVKERQASDQLFSLNYDPNADMNPIRAKSSANMQFWSLMYDSVFIVNPDWSVSSEVVTEWESEDYVWWVFHVDTSIPFSDGTTLTAADVAYSIQRAQQTEYYGERLSCIYGISAFGTDQFAISTKYANSQLPALLNIPIIKSGEYFEDFPSGSGPYMLSEDHDCLVLFPENRHASEMPIDTIYLRDCMDVSNKIRAFEDASLDLVTNDPTGMYNMGYGSCETRYYDTSNMHFVGFNMESKYFSSFAARCAVGYAIDRESIVNNIMSGCGVETILPVHPGSYLYNEAYAKNFAYDSNKAESMFTNAGVQDYDSDGDLEMLVTGIVVELNIRFIVNNDSTAKVLAARQICNQLNELGITTTLHELTWADYIEELETGNYDMYYGEIRLTPDWNISAMFKPREARKKDAPFLGLNYSNTRDVTYGNLYETYLAAENDESRYNAFQDINRYVCETGIILPVCFERRELLTHRGVVTGVSPTQFDIFHNFNDWTIALK